MNTEIRNLAYICTLLVICLVTELHAVENKKDYSFDSSGLKEDLKTEGIAPPLVGYDQDAFFKQLYGAYVIAYKSDNYTEMYDKVITETKKSLNGTVIGAIKYISELYCREGVGCVFEKSVFPETEDQLNVSILCYARRELLISFLANETYSFNRDVKADDIEKISTARIRLAARMLKRLKVGVDAPAKKIASYSKPPHTGELEIGYGYQGGLKPYAKDQPRVDYDDSPAKLTGPWYGGRVTKDMLSDEQIAKEEKRVALAKLAAKQYYYDENIRIHKWNVLSAENDFYRGLERFAGKKNIVKDALVLAGYDTQEKRKIFWKRLLEEERTSAEMVNRLTDEKILPESD